MKTSQKPSLLHYLSNTIVFSLAIIGTISCTNEEPEAKQSFACTWPEGATVVETITDQKGIVRKLTDRDVYQLLINEDIYMPCNLPQQMQQDSLIITVSGYIIDYSLQLPSPPTFPITLNGIPMEITSIKTID